jgi:anaerobic ribonucleoside-triphosphate reductase
MRERLVAFQEETRHNYNLEATPVEGTSYRLARLDVLLESEAEKCQSGGEGSIDCILLLRWSLLRICAGDARREKP